MEKYGISEDDVQRLIRDEGLSREDAMEKVASGATTDNDPTRNETTQNADEEESKHEPRTREPS